MVTALNSSFNVIDSHTAGHPTRMILSGIPALKGDTVREKRDYFQANFDVLRSGLLHEPRGHAAMVGLVPVPSTVADYGAFFISSYVYLDMCGHGTIGLAKTLAFTGQLTAESGDNFTLETPAGVVTVGLDWDNDGSLQKVNIKNVPTYVGLENFSLGVDGVGDLSTDIVYGGMWYALVDATALGYDLVPGNASTLMLAGSKIKNALKTALSDMPLFQDAATPSVLFYADESADTATHFLVLESNKFDRSPCGTGTSARLTHLLHTGALRRDQTYFAKNIFGNRFEARFAGTATANGREAVVIEIEGNAFITSQQNIFFEAGDPLAGGFLCS